MTVGFPVWSCWTDEFVLSHCAGYRVEDELGWHVGFVEQALVADEEFGPALALVVRVGRVEGGSVVIPIGEVVAVEPAAERLVVRAGSHIRGAGSGADAGIAV